MFAESAWCIPTQELYQAYHEIVISVTDWQYYGVISVALAPGSNSNLDHQTCLNWNRFSKSDDRNHHHENTVQWFYRRQYPNLKLFLIFTYTVATSFVLETPIHAFPEIKKKPKQTSNLKSRKPLCMYVLNSRSKQSKNWTLGVLADARGPPENMGNPLCPGYDTQSSIT